MSKEPELAQIHAGFPSPAEDFMDVALDLNKELVRNSDLIFIAVKPSQVLGVLEEVKEYIRQCWAEAKYLYDNNDKGLVINNG